MPPARPSLPPTPPPPSVETRTRQIYDEYVAARKRAGESTDGITYERLSRSLADQTEKLRAQHPNRRLDFEVTQKDGKPVIRPIVK